MPLDESFVGREFPDWGPYLVSRERIAEFALAIGDENPAYRSSEAAQALGHADVVAPPTFLVIISKAATDPIVFDPELGLDFSTVVHGDQGFVLHRPVVAGDRLLARPAVEKIRSAAGTDLLSLAVHIANDRGDTVATVRSTLVARAAARSAEGRT
jgi:acyl dehydratase